MCGGFTKAIAAVGAMPYIDFKENATGGIGGVFGKAFHYYNAFRDDFLKHYHKRSNVESTFSMMKAKFGDSIRSKSDPAMINEALCKILCHNICCLIQSIFELGIEATFWGEPAAEAEPQGQPAIEAGATGADGEVEAWGWV